MPPKGRKKAYKMPKPLPEGEVLKDFRKKEWKLGAPLGSGGFGLIYRAAESKPGSVSSDAPYVVKIEPIENGPLFTEIHFYQRAAQPEKVDSWQKQHKLTHLGVPKLCGSGTHQRDDVRYRFLVMRRFGEDIWKKYLACDKKFPPATVFALALQILDSLEYLHGNEYVHADIKSANLLLGHSAKDQNKIFLVDFGLVNRYMPEGVHKEYKEDPRKGHNGTPEFTSIDAHKGVAPSRRGDIQILGYVMLQWLCSKLPWEDKLTDLVYVMNQKIKYSTNITGLLKTCFKASAYPDELKKFLDHAFKLEHDEEPDYNSLRGLCRSVLKREGFKEGTAFNFGTKLPSLSSSQNRPVTSPQRAKSPRVAAQAKKRKAPSRERDRSQSVEQKRAKESGPGASGAASAAASPVKAKAAANKKNKTVKSPPSKSPVTPKAAKPKTVKRAAAQAKQVAKTVNGRAAGVSTPSRKVRRSRTKPAEMQSSATQTTPGLEGRAGRRR